MFLAQTQLATLVIRMTHMAIGVTRESVMQ